jgi:AcrR family transcriptional regulator
MPRKSKYSSEDIIQAAFKVVRFQGAGKLSAYNIAQTLNSSTMPIYSYLKSMKNLEEEIVKRAFSLLLTYETTERTGDIYLDMGIGYVLFAKKEELLFRCITDLKHKALYAKYKKQNQASLLEKLSTYPDALDLTEEQKKKLLFHGLIFSHGLADLIINSVDENLETLNTEEDIINFFLESGRMFWEGWNTYFTGDGHGPA